MQAEHAQPDPRPPLDLHSFVREEIRDGEEAPSGKGAQAEAADADAVAARSTPAAVVAAAVSGAGAVAATTTARREKSARVAVSVAAAASFMALVISDIRAGYASVDDRGETLERTDT